MYYFLITFIATINTCFLIVDFLVKVLIFTENVTVSINTTKE
jgi:hypothetical protein